MVKSSFFYFGNLFDIFFEPNMALFCAEIAPVGMGAIPYTDIIFYISDFPCVI
jgi:hypothetical protein